MINIKNSIRGNSERVDINMGPLVDMVFLLLIFFVVTTSFVKETGIEVQRATASTAEVKNQSGVMVGVSSDGEVYFDGKKIDVRSLRALVERSLAENPDTGVIVVADKDSETGIVIQAMDQCRLAGALKVSLAAKRTGAE